MTALGGFTPHVRAALFVVGLAVPVGVRGQDHVLEHWTLDVLSDEWAPRWSPDTSPIRQARQDTARVAVHMLFEGLRLSSSLSQSVSAASVSASQPLRSSLVLHVHATSARRSADAGNRPLMSADRASAASVGLSLGRSIDPLGRLHLDLRAGWDGGVGGEAEVSAESRAYSLRAAAWWTRSRDYLVSFPADSLRDVGIGQSSRGVRMHGTARLPLGSTTIWANAGAEFAFLSPAPDSVGGFLSASPPGDARSYVLALAAAAGEWRVEGSYHARSVDVDATLYRSGLSAGRLFYARVHARRGMLEARRRLGTRRLSLGLRAENVTGELSTRLETWPFLSLWGTLSVQAYRLRGSLDGRSVTVRVAQEPLRRASGWAWGVGLGRYEMRTDRESWFVTSLGFGREDEEATTAGADPAYVVSADVGRRLGGLTGTLEVRVWGGVPVWANDPGGDGQSGGGFAGYGGIAVGWSR